MTYSIEILLHKDIIKENETSNILEFKKYIERTTYKMSKDEAYTIYDIIAWLDVVKEHLANYFE